MPLPDDNSYFQLGDFTGFKTAGFCSVVQRFQPKELSEPLIGPVRGQFLAVIDNPWWFDQTDGRRQLPGAAAPLPFPTDPSFDAAQAEADALAGKGPAITERIDHEYQDANNCTTIGADGAWLECRDVEIQAGKRLWFHWRFARFDASPFNDFAMFLAYPGDNTALSASDRIVLCDVITLEHQVPSGGASTWTSPWSVGVFEPPLGFRGTLRWVASNGFSMSKLRRRRPPERYLRPSALLIDNISIE